MSDTDNLLTCPVCGRGTMVHNEQEWKCSEQSCGFVIPNRVFNLEMTEELVTQLVKYGHTGVLSLLNRDGQHFKAALVIRNGKVDASSGVHYIDGACPICGGKMRKTSKGYRCENSIGEHPSCDFMIPGIICNRRITEQDAVAFLNGKHIALEGFASNEWKMFASSLSIAEGKVKLESRIAKCPHCGGDLHVGLKAYNCANYRNTEHPCKFSIWRNISGHAVSVEEVKQICEQGVTRDSIEFYKEDGTVYYKRLQLTPEKDRIIMI